MRVSNPGEREPRIDSKPASDVSTPDVEPAPSKPFKRDSPPMLVNVPTRLWMQGSMSDTVKTMVVRVSLFTVTIPTTSEMTTVISLVGIGEAPPRAPVATCNILVTCPRRLPSWLAGEEPPPDGVPVGVAEPVEPPFERVEADVIGLDPVPPPATDAERKSLVSDCCGGFTEITH